MEMFSGESNNQNARALRDQVDDYRVWQGRMPAVLAGGRIGNAITFQLPAIHGSDTKSPRVGSGQR
jgi:hypothetical protein